MFQIKISSLVSESRKAKSFLQELTPVEKKGKNETNRVASLESVWMDDLQFYVLFNSFSVVSGQWEVDNERLCARNSVYS